MKKSKTLIHCEKRLAMQLAGVLLAILFSSIAVGQPTAITWGTSKDVHLDFGDEFVRVGSDYASFSFATGFGTDVAYPTAGPELFTILSSSDSSVESTVASAFEAVSSSVAQWHLFKDNLAGTATLTNSVAGTAAIEDSDDDSLVAVSWAMQSSSVDLGVPGVSGTIDWESALEADAGGGGLVNATGAYSISDPIVVWVENTVTGIVEPHRVFEFTAQADELTEMHWNDLRLVSPTGDVTLLPNTGPFLDATAGGSGSFSLAIGSDLVPIEQHGTVAISFEDGIVTDSSATGVFTKLAPRNGPVAGLLPSIGEPALIGSLLIDNDDADGRFQLNLNAETDSVITDIGTCSEGVQVVVGPTVDSVQTFAVDPSNRAPLEVDNNLTPPSDRAPRPCFGPIADGDLLFGNGISSAGNVTLATDGDVPTIDRYLELSLPFGNNSQTVLLDKGNNNAPADTRRWEAKVRVRDSGEQNANLQIFSLGLVDVATHGEEPDSNFTLFSSATDAITFSIGREGDETSLQLSLAGVRSADAEIPAGLLSGVDWNDVEVSVEEQSNATRFLLHIVDGDTSTTILDTTIDDFQLSEQGYRLAVGSRTINTAGGNDFDNLVMTYQQNGDLNWDSLINGTDVAELLIAIDNGNTDTIFDTNQDGAVGTGDLELLEDLVSNKLPGDANFDGTVDFTDFLALSNSFGHDTGLWSNGDFDGDNRVDFPDFLLLSQNFGTTQATLSVPEPSGSIMVLIGFLVTIRLAKRRSGIG